MALAPVERPNGLNISGICYFDVVPVADVESMPFPIMLNVMEDVVLKPGKVWIRIKLAPPGGRLVENWVLVNGEQVSDLTITGFAGKDELEKLKGFWEAKNDRWLVVPTCMDGDQLIAGRPEEGCRLLVDKRDRGDDGAVINGYGLQFTNRRLEPVPYYQGTPPEAVDLTECPTLAQLIAPEDGDDVFSLFSTEQRIQTIQAMNASTIYGYMTDPQKAVILALALSGATGGEIWAGLDAGQQAELLTAAGVVTVTGIDNTGPPYTDVIIDPTS